MSETRPENVNINTSKLSSLRLLLPLLGLAAILLLTLSACGKEEAPSKEEAASEETPQSTPKKATPPNQRPKNAKGKKSARGRKGKDNGTQGKASRDLKEKLAKGKGRVAKGKNLKEKLAKGKGKGSRDLKEKLAKGKGRIAKSKGKGSKSTRQNKPSTLKRSRSFLRVHHLMSKDEVREIFKFRGSLEEDIFQGQNLSASYNTFRLRPSEGGLFGFGLQLWKESSKTRAQEEFNAFFLQSVGGIETRDIGARSFETKHHKMRSLVFLTQTQNNVVWLTCDQKLCDSKQLVRLAHLINEKL